MNTVLVVADDETLIPLATALAENIKIPQIIVGDDMPTTGSALIFTHQGLMLKDLSVPQEAPIYVDFSAPKLLHRCQQAGAAKQTLAKAVGIKPGYRPTVIDATAGLGRDAFVLAALGCKLTLMERNPIVEALLLDGLRRGQAHPYSSKIIQSFIRFVAGDAVKMISGLADDERPDVIYLDPMFPHRSKSAQVKKEMRLFQTIVGVDEDLNELLDVALNTAKKRVVVKRPNKGPESEVRTPQLTLTGKSTRYDIYFTHI